MRDRDYQREAMNAAFSEWDRGVRATMIVAETGTGKTTVCARIIQRVLDEGGDVLFLVHREELLLQTYKAFKEMIPGVEIAREGSQQFKETTSHSRIVIAMVQSMRSRFKRMGPDRFSLVCEDELFVGNFDGSRLVGLRDGKSWFHRLKIGTRGLVDTLAGGTDWVFVGAPLGKTAMGC